MKAWCGQGGGMSARCTAYNSLVPRADSHNAVRLAIFYNYDTVKISASATDHTCSHGNTSCIEWSKA